MSEQSNNPVEASTMTQNDIKPDRNLLNSIQITDTSMHGSVINERLTNEEISRFSRHLLMEEIGVQGQMRLKKSRILIVGAGGLGCPSALYLAAAGVGNIGLVDYDTVELSNLQRQVIHCEQRVGVNKATSASIAIQQLNHLCSVIPHETVLNSGNAMEIINGYDIVLDASDNAATRYLINDACVLLKKPLVSGSALRMEGQITTYNYNGGPCYRCLFPNPPPASLVTNCSDGGVLGAITGVIGVMQALEAIKIVIGAGASFSQQLALFDGTSGKFRYVKLRHRRTDCVVCGDNPTITALIDYEAFCGAPACDKTLSLKILDKAERISCIEYKDLLFSSSSHVLLDVRPSIQYQICAIPKSSNIPLTSLSKADAIEQIRDLMKLHNTDIVYTICRRGNDSQLAVKLLKENGIANVKDVIGGLEAWNKMVDSDFPTY